MHSAGGTVQTSRWCSWRDRTVMHLSSNLCWGLAIRTAELCLHNLQPASFKTATDPKGRGHCLGASVTLSLVCSAVRPCAPASTTRDRAGTVPALSAKLLPGSGDVMLWPCMMALALVEWGHCLSLHSQGVGWATALVNQSPSNQRHPPPLPAPPANLSLSYVNQTRFGACPEKPFNYCWGWRSLLVIVSPLKMDLGACQLQLLPSFTGGEAQTL